MKNSFSKEERWLPKKTITALFSEGNRTYSKYLTAKWNIEKTKKKKISMVISVPKHTHKLAVHRNYIKRLIKEAYIKNKNVILKSISLSINIILIYNKSTIPKFNILEEELVILFQKINNNLYENN
tara:strand:- start:181 stop:558 length:378 start_codon:yes stop_codon:yes gene_type:complete